MTYGYIRVSSDRQTVENQRYEIGQFCKREGLRRVRAEGKRIGRPPGKKSCQNDPK